MSQDAAPDSSPVPHLEYSVSLPVWLAFRHGSFCDRLLRYYAVFGPDNDLNSRGIGVLIGLPDDAAITKTVTVYRNRLLKSGMLRKEARPDSPGFYWHVVHPQEFPIALDERYLSHKEDSVGRTELTVDPGE